MAHEIGHVLGFNHPDTLTSLNLRAKASAHACSTVAPHYRHRVPPRACSALSQAPFTPSTAICDSDPLDDGAVLSAPIGPSGAPDTIMMSRTAHRPRTCLTQARRDGRRMLAAYARPAARSRRAP